MGSSLGGKWFSTVGKEKNIKLNSLDNPKEEKNRFGLSRKLLNEKKTTLTLLVFRHFLAVKELAEKKNIKKQFFNFKKDKDLK